jgi:hypothetical protein
MFIKQALAMIGISLSAKDVAGRFLDEICAEQMGFDRAMLTMMDYVCGATDGWRKKSCLSGAGLMNFCVMGNQGAFLYDVKNCTDLRKNAEGIANLLEEMAVGIMGGEDAAHRFAGWVMDNTRANVAAMGILEERRPEWVSVGCTGHCAALAMKDFCKFLKTSGRYSSSWGVEWLDATNRDANTAANYLNDSGCAKAIVHQHQLEIYGAKKAIVVSVPTRFGTNQFVMQGLERSQAALKQAASDPKWDRLDGKAQKVGELFSSCTFWTNLGRATAFLQPFNDYIHQMEADRPALGRVYQGLVQLDRHVRSSLQQWEAAEPELADSCEIALRTWERRLENKHSSAVQPLLQPAHVAAFMLDPLYADAVSEKEVNVPKVPARHEDMARKLIQRVGGAVASRQFTQLLLGGFSGSMAHATYTCAQSNGAAQPATAGSKRPREQVASVKMRKGVWSRYGSEQLPELAPVALRLLSVHPTSAATERNWALWGRVYTSARNALGLERAKKLITFCFNSRAQEASMEDFALLLSVVEDEVVDSVNGQG